MESTVVPHQATIETLNYAINQLDEFNSSQRIVMAKWDFRICAKWKLHWREKFMISWFIQWHNIGCRHTITNRKFHEREMPTNENNRFYFFWILIYSWTQMQFVKQWRLAMATDVEIVHTNGLNSLSSRCVATVAFISNSDMVFTAAPVPIRCDLPHHINFKSTFATNSRVLASRVLSLRQSVSSSVW